MFKWMKTPVRNYDAKGRLLREFGGILIGIWFGVEIALHWRPMTFPFGPLVGMIGLGLTYYADRRAKPKERIELSLK